ncbi:MAG TPA: hypothetical protein VNZ57_05415 [Longimicrobiales bacterium]|nr:hypothetical protein [Longimicrobiales bacterium]
MTTTPLDPRRIRVLPLAERESLSRVDDILVASDSPAPGLHDAAAAAVATCADRIRAARERGAGVLLFYGAHLLRNGAAPILGELMARGWLTHLATNGAGTIHDWEYAWLGRSLEDVRDNVARGTFGTWDETGRWIYVALLAGGLRGEGYGEALGRFIHEDGTKLPAADELEDAIRAEPAHPLTAARAAALNAIREHGLPTGRIAVRHQWKHASVLAQAYRHGVGMTVHPGIGYDIIANHPMFDGAVIGRAATIDFHRVAGAIDTLDGGVVLSIGSAIMAPQVFEKALSCVHNIRFQEGREAVSGHAIYVVDIQDGGGWDWRRGEPPRTSPAYYLRFCKSFSRMGGEMHYVQCDNLAFLHKLYRVLSTA